MIVLFEENEKSFSTLGLGVLKDATSCIVREKLNDEFSLSMEYPVKGNNFSKIKNNRIICVKPNPYSEPQAFRIYNVTKAINGRVIVDANHISYDANSIPVKAFSATSLQDVLVQIQNGCIVDNPFTLSSDISRSKSYKTTAPYNLRAILMSDEESIVTEYDAELEFDNYVIKILAKRGKNRGAIVRYGHNMTDINHSLSTDLLYNGVFPYYHTEKTSTETTTADEFPQVYIVGSKTYQDGWLSYSKDGEPYHPMDESPVQIATEGEYYQKVFTWNTLYNVYQERVYNEQVTIIQGLTEPSWLTIDWSRFPLIVIKAAQKGYYKKATDTDWGEIKGVGDIIFEGSITSSGLMENLIISYSEVIPSKSTSKNEEVTEIVDVQLDQPIMWIDTNDAKSMLHDRILMLDLTSEFEEEPSQINLRAKAEEYINKHKIGTIKHSTTLSFVDLSATAEGSRFENLDHVELGDTVKVIYEDANIEVELRVITTEYDVLSGRYNSVELGEKKDKMSSSTIQNGDNVSALTNDVGYATVTTVNKLIANIITANYIEALNAKLSSAQISQLSVERINCTGIIEASQFTIDSLVAKLLVADNAEIADTLTAGNIKVAGDIAINSGQITITSDKGTKFIVDRDGNLTANSVSITGGNLNINDGVFEVTNDGVLTATAADITGSIRAKEGEIAGFVIAEKQLHYNDIGSNSSVVVSPGIEATISNLDSASKYWAFTASNKFGVTTSGVLYAKDAVLSGTITATAGYIANFKIKETSIVTYVGGIDYGWNVSGDGIYLGSNGLKLGDGFKVGTDGKLVLTKGSLEIQNGMYTEIALTPQTYVANTYYTKDIYGDYNLATGSYDSTATYYQYDGTKKYFGVDSLGNLTANSVKITGGELTIGGSSWYPNFRVDRQGNLEARSAYVEGGIHIESGEIIMGGTATYEQVSLTSSSYRRYVYYLLVSGNYVVSTGAFDPTATYYKYKSGANFYVRYDGHVEATDLVISGGSITINDTWLSTTRFKVTNDGKLTATGVDISGDVDITSGSITIKNSNNIVMFKVTDQGKLTASDADVTGKITASSGEIGGATYKFTIGYNSSAGYIYSGVTSLSDTSHNGIYLGTDGINLGGGAFKVTNTGSVTASDISITGGSIEIKDGTTSNFKVSTTGLIDLRDPLPSWNGSSIVSTIFFNKRGITLHTGNISSYENTTSSSWRIAISTIKSFKPYNGMASAWEVDFAAKVAEIGNLGMYDVSGYDPSAYLSGYSLEWHSNGIQGQMGFQPNPMFNDDCYDYTGNKQPGLYIIGHTSDGSYVYSYYSTYDLYRMLAKLKSLL